LPKITRVHICTSTRELERAEKIADGLRDSTKTVTIPKGIFLNMVRDHVAMYTALESDNTVKLQERRVLRV